MGENDENPISFFASMVSRCANGLLAELKDAGLSEDQGKTKIVHLLIDFAAGEACRIARRNGREPDRDKWLAAVNRAFDEAVARTAPPQEASRD
ncbi:MAG: hypothetical protein ACK4MV_16225 [Beijerinckiaceae bacterium]